MQKKANLLVFVCRSIPVAILFLVICVAYVYTGFRGINIIIPSWDIIFIYFWLIYKPDLLPILFIFLLGLLQDILSNNIIGLSSLLNILVARIILSKYALFFLRDFKFLLVFFVLCSFGVIFTKWLIMNFIFFQKSNLMLIMMQWMLTIAIYPFFHFILEKIDQFISGHVDYVSARE